jgi:hypothetical protein
MDKTLLTESYNFHAVKTGLAYLGLYSGGLSLDIQDDLIAIYKKAKSASKGIWKLDKTRLFTVTTLADLQPTTGNLVYPKIFRRCVDALRWVGGEFLAGRDLDDFLVARPIENNRIIVRAVDGELVESWLSDILEQINDRLSIQVDLNTVEFVSK